MFILLYCDILTASGDNMNDIIFRLLDFINNSKNKDTNYFIALTLLHDVKNIPNMNITTLADRCYTSPAAITRFCKKIGYKSFQEFKDYAKTSVEDDVTIRITDSSDKEVIAQELQEALYNKIVNWLVSSKNMIDFHKAFKIIELIHYCKKVSFFGTQLSQAIAQDFQLRLVKHNKFVSAFSDIQEQFEDVEDLDEDSAAIVISPSGRFINGNIPLLEAIKKTGCKLVIITHNKEVPFLEQADIVYYLNGSTYDETGFSSERFSLMYFFDFMIAFYSQLYGYK
ncbi:RpiR family transcriptional regulator [Fonticella tunisiensis]|uniref:RpiR family transcriptional regulator n=2 Tax=Fonticella tunisiensis TaxID=1096341 RepID=A0A4R7KVA7_9CLOT|nr:RpiR family transcriptional regulator [Fonticella tunisiensis]